MLHLHRDESQYPELMAYGSEINHQLEAQQEHILDSVGSEALANQLRTIGFEPNAVVSNNRQPGPSIVALGMVVNRLLDYFEADDPTVDTFLNLTLITDRYTDLTDDLLDDDVPDGAITEVMMTREILVPLLVDCLSKLDSATVQYWTNEILHLSEVLFKEATNEPSAAGYRSLLDQQAILFTSITGAAAVQLSRSTEEIRRSETLGRCLFIFSQIVRDCESHVPSKQDAWNAHELFTRSETLDLLRSQAEEFERQCVSLFDERPHRMEHLLDVGIDSWGEEVLGGQ